MRHGLQLAGVTLLWLAGINVTWRKPNLLGFVGMSCGNFYRFTKATDSPIAEPKLHVLCNETMFYVIVYLLNYAEYIFVGQTLFKMADEITTL